MKSVVRNGNVYQVVKVFIGTDELSDAEIDAMEEADEYEAALRQKEEEEAAEDAEEESSG